MFRLGLIVYGVGAVLSAVAPGLGVLILGNSILEGVGTALLIPPVYILTTMLFLDLRSRAWAFGVISALGGIGAATGPLIGGVITTTITWRAAFIFQALIIVAILVLARPLKDPAPADPTRSFDIVGAICRAAGLVILVGGIMAADQSVGLMVFLIVLGALVLGVSSCGSGAGNEPDAKPSFRPSCSVTTPRTAPRDAKCAVGDPARARRSSWPPICKSSVTTTPSRPGVIFTAATVGILLSSLAARPLAKRFRQRALIASRVHDRDRGHRGAWWRWSRDSRVPGTSRPDCS